MGDVSRAESGVPLSGIRSPSHISTEMATSSPCGMIRVGCKLPHEKSARQGRIRAKSVSANSHTLSGFAHFCTYLDGMTMQSMIANVELVTM